MLDGQDQAQLYVTRAYDLFGIWHDRWGYPNDPNQLYYSTPTDGAPWHPVRWRSSVERVSDRGPYGSPETVDPIGQLRVSKTGAFVTTLDAVALGEGIVRVRLPWTLLQFSDPSRAFVIQDLRRATPPDSTKRDLPSEGIRVVIVQGSALLASDRLLWNGWEDAPHTTEREKASVPILAQYLRAFDHSLELRLRIAARTADSLTLDWLGGGVLQEAPSVTGPWSEVGRGAPTTVALLPSGSQCFRVTR